MKVTIPVRILLTVCLLLPIAKAVPAQDEEYVANDPDGCRMCHNSPHVLGVLETPHFTSGNPASPGEQQGCQSCHGPAGDHLANPMNVKPLRFGKDSNVPVEKQNAACLGCHEKQGLSDWHTSTHASAGVTCASCHDVHSPRDAALDRDRQLGLCFDCHQEKRQALRRRSHHPIEEGLVACGDCHNPHGSAGPGQLRAASVNDTCNNCHSEKRGPFLWEHPPAADDCTNCHQPHGSVHPNLLTQRTPFLCQQCHSEAYHPGTLRSGTGLPSAMADNKLLGGGCTNCHSQVHGSNHPSGTVLTR